MSLMEKSTDNLMNALKRTGPSEVKEYLQENFKEGQPTFTGYIDRLLQKKGLKRQDVLIKADFSQKYGYKLLSGESHTTDRDKIIRICLAMELTLQETQRALKLYGMNELYPKVKRDVLVIVAIGQKMYDIDWVNEMLEKEGEKPLYDAESE